MAVATEAVERARRGGIRIYEPAALLARAHVRRRVEGPRAEVEADLRDGLEVVASTGARSWAPLFHEEQAHVALGRGDRATFGAQLEHAQRLYAENGATAHADRLARELAT